MKLKESSWDVGLTLPEVVKQRLTEEFGEPVEESGERTEWSHSELAGVYNAEVTYIENEMDLKIQIRSWVVPLIILALSFIFFNAYIGDLQTSILVFLFLGWLLFVYILLVPLESGVLRSIGEIREWHFNPYFFYLAALGLLLMWWKLRSRHPRFLVDGYMAIAVVLFLILCFSKGLIPKVSSSPEFSVLVIPMAALTSVFVPLVLFGVFAFIPGYFSTLTRFLKDALFDYKETAQSVVREEVILYGDNVYISRGDSVRFSTAEGVIIDVTDAIGIKGMQEQLAMLNLRLFWDLVIIVGVFIVVFMVFSRMEIEYLRSIESKSFDSNGSKYIFLFSFAIADIALVGATIPAFATILYGFTGSFPIPWSDVVYTQILTQDPMKIEIPYYMMDSSEAFQRSHQPTAEELIKNSYRSLDSSFKRFPFFSARIYSLIYYSVMFSPVFLIVMGWALSFVLDYGSRVYYLFRGEWRQINLSEVSRSVSLLVIPEEEVPVARPVSLFFGLYTFVVISEAVRSELSDEQLKSVVAHEFYHLRNRDMFVNMVASFLSIGFSSRNALLAFYDYTQSEKEADDFARETVGLDPTVIAIDKLDVLAKNAEGRRLPWGGPEFVRSPIKEQSFGRIGGVLKSSAAVLLAPYQLLFGRIILDTAHLNSESRIERLKNLS